MTAPNELDPRQSSPTTPTVPTREEPATWDSTGMGLAVAATLLAILFAAVALVLTVSTGWPGVVLFMLALLMGFVAASQIRKSKPER